MKPGACDLCLYFDVLQFFLLQFIAANYCFSLVGWGLSIKLIATKIIASDENGMDGEADSVISGNHHELWLANCSLVCVSMNCTKLICAIISLNSYLDPSTWKLEVISNGLERGQFNPAQPGCIISATWKAFYLYWELKRFSNGHFMLFVSICRPHNWNKCTGTTLHIPLNRNEH